MANHSGTEGSIAVPQIQCPGLIMSSGYCLYSFPHNLPMFVWVPPKKKT